jgi:hypothetical protein
VSDFFDATGNTFGEDGADLDGAAYVATFYINTALGTLVDASTLNPSITGQVVAGGAEGADLLGGGALVPNGNPVSASLEINGVTQTFVAGAGADEGELADIVYDGAGLYGVEGIVFGDNSGIDQFVTGVNPFSPQEFGVAFSEQNLPSEVGYGAFALPTAEGDITATTVTSLGIVNFTSGAPEPSTWLLMIVGVGVAGGCLRRRGKVAHLPLLTAAGA